MQKEIQIWMKKKIEKKWQKKKEGNEVLAKTLNHDHCFFSATMHACISFTPARRQQLLHILFRYVAARGPCGQTKSSSRIYL